MRATTCSREGELSFLNQPPSAAQLGMAREFLEFCDQFHDHGTVTRRRRSIPVSGETFASEFRKRWAKVKPIFNADEEQRLRQEIDAIEKLLAEKRKNSARKKNQFVHQENDNNEGK